jgi:hypothetical protein
MQLLKPKSAAERLFSQPSCCSVDGVSNAIRQIEFLSQSMEKALASLQGLFVWLLDLGSNQGPTD